MFATVPRTAFRFVRGTPRCYRSSSFGRRWFCGDCGSALCMQVEHEPGTTDVAVATMDAAGEVAPQFRSWHGARLAWFETADALPRYAAARPAASSCVCGLPSQRERDFSNVGWVGSIPRRLATGMLG
jgi:hypothetical protein